MCCLGYVLRVNCGFECVSGQTLVLSGAVFIVQHDETQTVSCGLIITLLGEERTTYSSERCSDLSDVEEQNSE